MKIYNDIKIFIKSPDEFVKNKSKNAIYYSTVLKILSLAIFLLKIMNPFFYIIVPLKLFAFSLYIDYKILANIDYLAFLSFQKNIVNNPYKCGYYLGRITATIIKTGFFQRLHGFYNGFKKELL